VTTYARACAWCSRQYRTSRPEQAYCSLPCQQRHAWFGVVPDRQRPLEQRYPMR
jgi:hypothetical protein